MKKLKYLLFIIVFLLCMSNVKAECTDSEINELKEKSKKITITYEQVEPFEKISMSDFKTYMVYDNYIVTISNFTDDFYFKINDDSYQYNSNITDENNAFIYQTIGNKYLYHIYSTKCSTLVRDIYLYLPKYNYFSYEKECEDIASKTLKDCTKWIEEEDYEYFENLDYETFVKNTSVYTEKNIFEKVLVFLNENLLTTLIVAGSIILLIIIIIIVILKKKRGRLE